MKKIIKPILALTTITGLAASISAPAVFFNKQGISYIHKSDISTKVFEGMPELISEPKTHQLDVPFTFNGKQVNEIVTRVIREETTNEQQFNIFKINVEAPEGLIDINNPSELESWNIQTSSLFMFEIIPGKYDSDDQSGYLKGFNRTLLSTAYNDYMYKSITNIDEDVKIVYSPSSEWNNDSDHQIFFHTVNSTFKGGTSYGKHMYYKDLEAMGSESKLKIKYTIVNNNDNYNWERVSKNWEMDNPDEKDKISGFTFAVNTTSQTQPQVVLDTSSIAPTWTNYSSVILGETNEMFIEWDLNLKSGTVYESNENDPTFGGNSEIIDITSSEIIGKGFDPVAGQIILKDWSLDSNGTMEKTQVTLINQKEYEEFYDINESNNKNGLSVWTIVGISIGSATVVAAVVWFWRRNKIKKQYSF